MSKILIIDDEEANVRILSLSLRSDGYEVVTAHDGVEGLETFRRESPQIVLTDIRMPGMDGIEVLKSIRALEPDVEVIIFTGHGDIDHAIEALKYGASDFINKPIRDEALSIALQRAHEKIEIKRRLKDHMSNLEEQVQMATRELRRKTNFLSKVITSSTNAIVATDETFKVVVYNPEAERIFGYSAEEVVEVMDVFTLYPPDIAEAFCDEHSCRRVLGDTGWMETEVVGKDGTEIPVRFSGSFLRESHKVVGCVAFLQDLRDIKRLEKELLRSERLATIGQTVAGLAHGIKNILHGLKGGSYLVNLGIKKNDSERLKSGWDMLQRNIQRTSDLVMDLLDYSKEREAVFEECSPNEIAEDVCELVRKEAEANDVEVVMDFDDSIGRVLMDPRTIHHTLLNLASNAVDACLFDEDPGKESWRVRVKTKREEEGFVAFVVEDNGKGMSEEVQKRIFSSFFSTKGHRGTGLGLLVTRKLIEEHGGSIQVHSEEGKGTTFVMRLPFKEMER